MSFRVRTETSNTKLATTRRSGQSFCAAPRHKEILGTARGGEAEDAAGFNITFSKRKYHSDEVGISPKADFSKYVVIPFQHQPNFSPDKRKPFPKQVIDLHAFLRYYVTGAALITIFEVIK